MLLINPKKMESNMKKIVIVVLFIMTSGIFVTKVSAQQPYVSFQVFYDQLSPYGQWVDYPNYGYAWIPDAGSDFFPYSTSGYWLFTEYGWTWVSDFNWGWAPFHYGRWDYDNYYGWFWIPDYEWAPAWVSWRRAEGYYGWSPMRPGVTISENSQRDYNYHNDRWVFVRDRYIGKQNIHRYNVNKTKTIGLLIVQLLLIILMKIITGIQHILPDLTKKTYKKFLAEESHL